MSENNNLIERLFATGSHFGFSKSRRHPSVKNFIFGNKQGTDIIDLEQTVAQIEAAKKMLFAAGEQGTQVLFVGTKDEASKQVKAAAEQVEMPYVTNRWIGGMITNFSEIKKRIERMKGLVSERETGELERKYTKKERVVIGREIDKLSFNFGGMETLEKTPGMMLVVDPRHDDIAVTEANDAQIPVVAIMSSDCDATKVAAPVVVNDALTASIELVLSELTTAYEEGKKNYVPAPARPRREGNRPRRNFDRR